jgi:hypothetical protein
MTVDSIMRKQVLYCVPLVWIGPMLSQSLSFMFIFDAAKTLSRTKARLRSGEIAVTGDQWPVFVYYSNKYDPEDPWDGLFRSNLLVSVSSTVSLVS